MRNEKTALNQIAAEVKEKLNEYVDQWLQKFAEDIQKLDTFPTIDQLEETMITLDMETRRMFLEMLSQCLSNVDEKQVVSSKKRVPTQRSDTPKQRPRFKKFADIIRKNYIQQDSVECG